MPKMRTNPRSVGPVCPNCKCPEAAHRVRYSNANRDPIDRVEIRECTAGKGCLCVRADVIREAHIEK